MEELKLFLYIWISLQTISLQEHLQINTKIITHRWRAAANLAKLYATGFYKKSNITKITFFDITSPLFPLSILELVSKFCFCFDVFI